MRLTLGALRLDYDAYNDGTSSAVLVRGTVDVVEIVSGKQLPLTQLDAAGKTRYYTNAAHVRVGYEASYVPEATPPRQYHFLYWKIYRNGVHVDSRTDDVIDLTLDADYRVQPFFDDLHQLTVNISPAASGTISILPPQVGGSASASQVVEYFPTDRANKRVTVIAVPKDGYAFSHWQGGSVEGVTEPIKSFDLLATETTTAVFVPGHELTVKTYGNAALNVSPPDVTAQPPFWSNVYPVASPPETVTITPGIQNFISLDHWVLDNEVIYNTGPLSVEMDTGHAVEAVFVSHGIPQVSEDVELQLTVRPGGAVQLNHDAPYEAWDQTIATGEHSETVPAGNSIQLVAIAESGMVFDHWVIQSNLETQVYALPQYFVSESTRIAAVFRPDAPANDFAVDVTSLGAGSVEPFVGRAYFNSGDDLALRATPMLGWRFVRWEGAVTSIEAHCVIPVTANMQIRAVFEPDVPWTGDYEQPLFELQVEEGIGGHAQPDYCLYPSGSTVTLAATALPSFVFDHWEGYPIDSEQDNPISLNLLQHARVRPIFHKLTQLQADPLTVLNGTLEFSPPQGDGYEIGTTVTITATADAGYQFDRWTGDLAAIANATQAANSSGYLNQNNMPKAASESLSIEITEDTNLDICAGCVFKKQAFKLNASSGGGGAIRVNPAKADFLADEYVTITAFPNPGKDLDKWTGDVPAGAGHGLNQIRFQMGSQNRSIEAKFTHSIPYYTVDVDAWGMGRIEIASSKPSTGDRKYPAGSTITIKAISTANPRANLRGEFREWQYANFTGGSTVTLTDLNKDYHGTAWFEPVSTKPWWSSIQIFYKVGGPDDLPHITKDSVSVETEGVSELVESNNGYPIVFRSDYCPRGYLLERFSCLAPIDVPAVQYTITDDRFLYWTGGNTSLYSRHYPTSSSSSVTISRDLRQPDCSSYELPVPTAMFDYDIMEGRVFPSGLGSYNHGEEGNDWCREFMTKGFLRKQEVILQGATEGLVLYPSPYDNRLSTTYAAYDHISYVYPAFDIKPTYTYVVSQDEPIYEGGWLHGHKIWLDIQKTTTQYNLRIVVDPPEGAAVTGDGLYLREEIAQIDIVPAEGYKVLGDLSPEFMMCGDREVTISAVRDCHVPISLSVEDSPGGTVSTAESRLEYNECSDALVYLRAIPDHCYNFERWAGDIGTQNPTSDTISLLMDQDRTVTPVFVLDPACASGHDTGEFGLLLDMNDDGELEHYTPSSPPNPDWVEYVRVNDNFINGTKSQFYDDYQKFEFLVPKSVDLTKASLHIEQQDSAVSFYCHLPFPRSVRPTPMQRPPYLLPPDTGPDHPPLPDTIGLSDLVFTGHDALHYKFTIFGVVWDSDDQIGQARRHQIGLSLKVHGAAQSTIPVTVASVANGIDNREYLFSAWDFLIESDTKYFRARSLWNYDYWDAPQFTILPTARTSIRAFDANAAGMGAPNIARVAREFPNSQVIINGIYRTPLYDENNPPYTLFGELIDNRVLSPNSNDSRDFMNEVIPDNDNDPSNDIHFTTPIYNIYQQEDGDVTFSNGTFSSADISPIENGMSGLLPLFMDGSRTSMRPQEKKESVIIAHVTYLVSTVYAAV